jgi:hypothetical protein
MLVASWLAACGGKGETSAAGAPTEPFSQPPPSDSDQATHGSGQRPPSNPDQPPSNSEQPLPNADAPPVVGNYSTLCQQLCERARAVECPNGGPFDRDALENCESECEVSDEVAACEPQYVAFFDCFLGLSDLCDIGDDLEDSEQLLTQCQGPVLAVIACVDLVEDLPDEVPSRDCSPGSGCASCFDACEACRCQTPDASLCDQVCR